MYCSNCGQRLDDGMNFCTNCGVGLVEEECPELARVQETGSNFGFGLLSFLEPIVGLVFFCVWKRNRPRRAKVCGINALIDGICSVILGLIFIVKILEYMYRIFYYFAGLLFLMYAEGLNSESEKIPVWTDATTVQQYEVDAWICYDGQTDTVIEANGNTVTVYERGLQKVYFTYSFAGEVTAVDAYNGVLVVGVTDWQTTAGEIYLYDLTTGEQTKTISSSIAVTEIVVTDGKFVYCDDDQWCEIWAYDFDKGTQERVSEMFYRPDLAVNHEEGIVYAVERHLSSCKLFYIRLDSLHVVSHGEHGEYAYNSDGVYFDGKYTHAFGCVFDAVSANKLSVSGYTQSFAQLLGEDASLYSCTLYDNDRYAILEMEQDGRVAVYDYSENEVVAILEIAPTEIYALANGDFIAVCEDGVVATVDMDKIL